MCSKDEEDQKSEMLKSSMKYETIIKIACPAIISIFLYILLIFKAISILSMGKSSPLFPFDMFSKCYVADDKCPNENITFWLFTR